MNDWMEFTQPAVPPQLERPVDDSEFAAISRGGPWTPVDWVPLRGEVVKAFGHARVGEWVLVLKALQESDLPVNLRDRDGATLITMAARAGRLDVLRELLRRGADVNRPGLLGLSPLGAAALGGHDLLVRELLRAGADPHQWSGQGQSPLHLAARGGHIDTMKTLVKSGADVMQFNREGRHVLAEAARTGQIGAMAWLLDVMKVPVDSLDQAGLNALHAAALGRHVDAVAWLSQRGARQVHPLTQVLLERQPDPIPAL